MLCMCVCVCAGGRVPAKAGHAHVHHITTPTVANHHLQVVGAVLSEPCLEY